MSTVNVYVAAIGTINDRVMSLGNRVVPNTIASINQEWHATARITNAATPNNYQSQVMWEAADAGIADFDFLFLESDKDVLVEFQSDNATPAYAVIKVKADIPLILSSDAFLAHTDTSQLGADDSAATPDVIDKITVKNNVNGTDPSVTAIVKLTLLT